jgi:imidazole glycerol-phosphate synthase subunit HisH
MDDVVIVDTGSANLASVEAALRRAGVTARIAAGPDSIARARRVVLPGVGSFGSGMAGLESRGLVDVLRTRIAKREATLAVCLGMQLLCHSSEESPGVAGLGLLPGKVRRFRDAPSIPQLGWNRVVPDESNSMITAGYAYFANSYRLSDVPAGWTGATSEHGDEFVAAVECGPVLACQFHPELSGDWGHALITRWLAGVEGGASC